MAWSRSFTDGSDINGGNEFRDGDGLSASELNKIVNNTLNNHDHGGGLYLHKISFDSDGGSFPYTFNFNITDGNSESYTFDELLTKYDGCQFPVDIQTSGTDQTFGIRVRIDADSSTIYGYYITDYSWHVIELPVSSSDVAYYDDNVQSL